MAPQPATPRTDSEISPRQRVSKACDRCRMKKSKVRHHLHRIHKVLFAEIKSALVRLIQALRSMQARRSAMQFRKTQDRQRKDTPQRVGTYSAPWSNCPNPEAATRNSWRTRTDNSDTHWNTHISSCLTPESGRVPPWSQRRADVHL